MKKLDKFILKIIGLLMFSAYIWLRFIRERLPKDIPFDLSIVGFFILVEICCIYAYILFIMFKKSHNSNAVILYIINQIYKPLITFDSFIKSLPGVESRYIKFMVFLAYKLEFTFKNTSIFYFVFAIFPRLFLVSVLVIDTFYFHKLFYIYKILLIGILLFFHRYIIYSFKHAKELLIVQKEPYASSVSMEYIPEIVFEIYGDTNEDCDEEDKDDIPPTMSIPLRKFIEIQTHAIVYHNRLYDFLVYHTQKYWEKVRIKYKLSPKDRIPMQVIRLASDEEDLQIDNINNIVQLSVILEYYHLTANNNERYKTIKKLIFGNYLLCWLYILIYSLHTLPTNFIMLLSNVISGIIMIGIIGVSYIYCYLIIKLEAQRKQNNKEKEAKKLEQPENEPKS